MPSKLRLRERFGIQFGASPQPGKQLPVATPRNISPHPAPPMYISLVARSNFLRIELPTYPVVLVAVSRTTHFSWPLRSMSKHSILLRRSTSPKPSQFSQTISFKKLRDLIPKTRKMVSTNVMSDKLSQTFELCNRCMSVIAVGAQASPEGSMIVGAIKLVIGV